LLSANSFIRQAVELRKMVKNKTLKSSTMNSTKNKNDNIHEKMSGGGDNIRLDHTNITNVWSFMPENRISFGENGNNYKHPTVKPLKLLERLIKLCTPEEATVLDCFVGSGTTAIACKNTNRNFIGCELFPEYYEIAMQRVAETDNKLFY